jgi:hypothetical protein
MLTAHRALIIVLFACFLNDIPKQSRKINGSLFCYNRFSCICFNFLAGVSGYLPAAAKP